MADEWSERESEREAEEEEGKRIISAFINPTCLAHTVPEVSGLML